MIIEGVCYSFKRECLQGIHSDSDTYKIALFTSSASIGPQTASYSSQAGEVANGNGYTTGGATLSGFSIGLTGAVAFANFADAVWSPSSIRARGALIYNASKGNRAVSVMDFGGDVVSTNGPFTVHMPANDADHALIALT